MEVWTGMEAAAERLVTGLAPLLSPEALVMLVHDE